MKFIFGGCTIRVCLVRHIVYTFPKQNEGGTIVHTCSGHYNTCHMFRRIIGHGCYSALLASYLELPDRQVYMNTVALYHYISSGGFASLCAFLVNELSSPMDVKHTDVQFHLREFLISQNMFLSISVVSHKPIVHHPNVYRLVENHVHSLCVVHNTCIPLIVVTLAILP